MKTLDLKINGMGSAHCVGVVKSIVDKQDGAAIEDIEIGKAKVTYDPGKVSPETIVQEIEKMGYKVVQ
jgi:copper chaperone CopZ